MTKSLGINKQKKYWTEEELVILKYLYPCTFTKTLATFFNCRLEQVYQQAKRHNFKKNVWYKATPMAQRLRRGDELGKPYRFKKGQVPLNKGIKGISYEGMKATQFKPGQKPPNHKPVGTVRICAKDGYLSIKMEEGKRQWVQLNRMIWERMNGSIPDGYVVTFIDGNKQNCKITNLTLMSFKENALRNSVHRFGKEIAQIYSLKAQINRQINKHERLQNERH